MSSLPDIQLSKPEVPGYINYVGVSNVKVPFKIKSKFGGCHEMIATVSMGTDLGSDKKGISMSRFIRTLKSYLNVPLNHDLINIILQDFKSSSKGQEAENAFMKFEFEYGLDKRSPLSDLKFPTFYNCKFEGRSYKDSTFRFFEGVKIQYASYCPCSNALCEDLRDKGLNGFPHAQRSFAKVLIEADQNNIVWIEDLIELVEYSVKNIPFPIIKREDEQEIARRASESPMFVEDSIRSICNSLNKNENIKDWLVKCDHEESIHTSNAIATCWKGIDGGFDGTYFL